MELLPIHRNLIASEWTLSSPRHVISILIKNISNILYLHNSVFFLTISLVLFFCYCFCNHFLLYSERELCKIDYCGVMTFFVALSWRFFPFAIVFKHDILLRFSLILPIHPITNLSIVCFFLKWKGNARLTVINIRELDLEIAS